LTSTLLINLATGDIIVAAIRSLTRLGVHIEITTFIHFHKEK
jgi:hypothetical protein